MLRYLCKAVTLNLHYMDHNPDSDIIIIRRNIEGSKFCGFDKLYLTAK